MRTVGIGMIAAAILTCVFSIVLMKKNHEDHGPVYFNSMELNGSDAEMAEKIILSIFLLACSIVLFAGVILVSASAGILSASSFAVVILIALGVIFTMVSYGIRYLYHRIEGSDRVSVQGIFLGNEKKAVASGIYYYPVIRFSYNGKTYCGTPMIGNSEPLPYGTGENVTIQFSAGEPVLFHLEKDEEGFRYLYHVFSAAGAALLAAGIVIWFITR